MALTEQDKAKIKDSVIASCIAKGLKPTTSTSNGVVPNPMYANCVQLGYQDALKKLSTGSGNLIKRAENIKKLGASPTKNFPDKLLNNDEE